MPELRDKKRRQAWASLVAFTAKRPCYPVIAGSELPLLPGSERPRISHPEWRWREWRTFIGPAGPTVEAVCIEGDTLMRRSILVPNNGRGSTILDGGIKLATSTAWAVARHVQYEDASWSRFRVMGTDRVMSGQ